MGGYWNRMAEMGSFLADQAAGWMGGYWNMLAQSTFRNRDQAAGWMGGYWNANSSLVGWSLRSSRLLDGRLLEPADLR